MSENLEPKDLLDIGWKYFQQHAQQRIAYFNFFVVFSVLVTSCLMTTFQEKFEIHYVGIFLGVCQIIISYVFWKIDERNKFLTKHGENLIQKIENKYILAENDLEKEELSLFSTEEKHTCNIRSAQKGKGFLKKQISHSTSFRIIFIFFFLIGLFGMIMSIKLESQDTHNKTSKASIIILDKSDTIKIVHK